MDGDLQVAFWELHLGNQLCSLLINIFIIISCHFLNLHVVAIGSSVPYADGKFPPCYLVL